jgi:Cu-Zn family superoxide dismutase
MKRLCRFLALVLIAIWSMDVAESKKIAVCKILSGSGNGTIFGHIYLTQTTSKYEVVMKVDLHGFNITGSRKHGFHVHQNGSLGNKCADAGPHLNVYGTRHGSPCDLPTKRHTGDLGNIEIDSNGDVVTTLRDRIISLYQTPTSVMNKTIVVHALEDDLGRGGAPTSNTTGNAGQRLGCCVITQIIPDPDC